MAEDHTVRNIAIVGGVLAAAYFLLRPAQAAAVTDIHGCYTLSGEVWCDTTTSCIKPSEGTPCPPPVQETPPPIAPPAACVGDGRGLMEIRAPSGSVYAAKGPWGWFGGTDDLGNPVMTPMDAGAACIITDVCWGGAGWKIIVRLPDGTTKDSGVFDFSQYPAPAEKNAACYYLFDVTPVATQPATGQSFAYRRKGIY